MDRVTRRILQTADALTSLVGLTAHTRGDDRCQTGSAYHNWNNRPADER